MPKNSVMVQYDLCNFVCSLFRWQYAKDGAPILVLRILSTILFIICIIAMMKYLDFSHCIWAKKIGGLSFGIYLIHFKVLEVLKHYGQFGIVQVILYIVLTFCLAYAFHTLQKIDRKGQDC